MSIEIKIGQKAVEYPAECYVALLVRSTEVPTYRTKGSGQKMSEWTVFHEEREIYTAYSRIRSIDGHGSVKKSPKINNSSRTIYLADSHKKLVKLFFSLGVKAKIIFLVLVCRRLFFSLLFWVWQKFHRRMWMFYAYNVYSKVVKYAKWICEMVEIKWIVS